MADLRRVSHLWTRIGCPRCLNPSAATGLKGEVFRGKRQYSPGEAAGQVVRICRDLAEVIGTPPSAPQSCADIALKLNTSPICDAPMHSKPGVLVAATLAVRHILSCGMGRRRIVSRNRRSGAAEIPDPQAVAPIGRAGRDQYALLGQPRGLLLLPLSISTGVPIGSRASGAIPLARTIRRQPVCRALAMAARAWQDTAVLAG